VELLTADGVTLNAAVARLVLRTRIWHEHRDPVPVSPVQCIADVAPLPLLIVHGDQDRYFPLEHPLSLAEAAGDGAQLWIEKGMGHAEKAATPELVSRLARQIQALASA
jgi:pimeloyl-ACP methyl ester carboxylesterase